MILIGRGQADDANLGIEQGADVRFIRSCGNRVRPQSAIVLEESERRQLSYDRGVDRAALGAVEKRAVQVGNDGEKSPQLRGDAERRIVLVDRGDERVHIASRAVDDGIQLIEQRREIARLVLRRKARRARVDRIDDLLARRTGAPRRGGRRFSEEGQICQMIAELLEPCSFESHQTLLKQQTSTTGFELLLLATPVGPWLSAPGHPDGSCQVRRDLRRQKGRKPAACDCKISDILIGSKGRKASGSTTGSPFLFVAMGSRAFEQDHTNDLAIRYFEYAVLLRNAGYSCLFSDVDLLPIFSHRASRL